MNQPPVRRNPMNTTLTACAVLIFSVPHLLAATFASGYTKGASSQLLTSNGGSGSVVFQDHATTGGDDIRFDGGNLSFGWLVDGSGSWSGGDTVSITGLALPIWANSLETDATNNTQNGTFTFSFYSAGADNTWDGTNALGTSDDSLLGTIDVTFASANTGVDEFYVNFDSALNWTADSSQIFFTFQNTGAVRLKTGPPVDAVVPQFNEATGAAVASSGVSLAGTVTVPEPSVALLGAGACLLMLSRRRRA